MTATEAMRWTATTTDSIHTRDKALPHIEGPKSSLQDLGCTTPPRSSHSSLDNAPVSFVYWTESQEKVVSSPYDYVAARPGKELRSLLLACFNEWLEVPAESLAVIDRAVRMLHTSSLLIDDIQDKSDLRRGGPTAHKIFGEALTINSGNYVYFLALRELSTLKRLDVVEIFTTEMLALHRGQGMDIFWRDTLTCPTEEEYFGMVSNKTGGLFRLAYKLMKAEAKAPVDLLSVVELLGILFQVADDYKNLCSHEYNVLKGFGEDLTEGKFSFPVIHGINSNPADLRLIHILQQRPTEASVKQHAIDIMHENGSLEYTKEVIQKLVVQVRNEIVLLDQDQGRGRRMLDLVEKITKSIGLSE